MTTNRIDERALRAKIESAAAMALMGATLVLSAASRPVWAAEAAAAPARPPKEHPLLDGEAPPACTECHGDLLAGKIQHPPAAESQCETCHEIAASGDSASVSLAAPVAELCVICHDSLAGELGRPRVHGAVEALGCTGCHNPHASDFPRLLRVESNALCQACHLLTASEEARAEGSVITLFGAHSVPSSLFSRIPRVSVRLQDGRGHPVARHPVSAESNPLRPKEPFGCVSCHEPHGSARPSLLVGPAEGSFCRSCHQK